AVIGEPGAQPVAQVTSLRYSDIGYVTSPTDAIPNVSFFPGVESIDSIDRNMLRPPEAEDRRASFSGEVQIANADGRLDTAIDLYAIDGRRVTIRMGSRSRRYEDFDIVFDGTAKGWRIADQGRARIELRDATWRLDIPLQTNLYGGSGGLAG